MLPCPHESQSLPPTLDLPYQHPYIVYTSEPEHDSSTSDDSEDDQPSILQLQQLQQFCTTTPTSSLELFGKKIKMPALRRRKSADLLASKHKQSQWLDKKHRPQTRSATVMMDTDVKWQDFVHPVVLHNLAKQETQRQQVIYELVVTETLYCEDLKYLTLVSGTLDTMLGKDKRLQLLINMDDIYKANKTFLRELEWRQKAGKFIVKRVGDLFKRWMAKFACYVDYCAHQQEQSEILLGLQCSNEHFSRFLKEFFIDPRSRRLPLTAFLLIPMQRLTRYSLLLRQLVQFTASDHEDAQDIQLALYEVMALLQRANEAARERQDQLVLKQLDQLIHVSPDFVPKFVLTSPTRYIGSRRLCLKGAVGRIDHINTRFIVFLMNDVLLFCEPSKTTNHFKLDVEPLPLADVTLRDPNKSILNFGTFYSVASCG
jgi:hypothetical protein